MKYINIKLISSLVFVMVFCMGVTTVDFSQKISEQKSNNCTATISSTSSEGCELDGCPTCEKSGNNICCQNGHDACWNWIAITEPPSPEESN